MHKQGLGFPLLWGQAASITLNFDHLFLSLDFVFSISGSVSPHLLLIWVHLVEA